MKVSQAIALIDIQARAGLKAEASKFFLSYLWWILEPLMFVAVFYVVFEFLLGRGQTDFVFFLMCGKVPYLWLSKSITIASNSLLHNRGLIASIDIPKVIFPYISVQEVLYKQWIVFLILVGISVYYGQLPNPEWIWLVPLILTNYLLLLVLSLVAALMVTYLQDFRIIINMGLMFLMFASGIFWDINDIKDEYWRDMLLNINPLAFLIDAYRQVFMYQTQYDYIHLAWIAGSCFGAVCILHWIFAAKNRALTQQVLQS